MQTLDDIRAANLDAIVRVALAKHSSPEEAEWIQKIEDLRKQILNSDEVLSIVDYGAGSPSLNLTWQQMYEGKVTSRTLSDHCRKSSLSTEDAHFLFFLIRLLQPKTCLELGTGVGISACYLAAALKLNGVGRLITIEGSSKLADIANENLKVWNLSEISHQVVGRFCDVLERTLIVCGPPEFVFLDGHHDGRSTLEYWRLLSRYCRQGATLVIDDMNWSTGMEKASREITSAYDEGDAIRLPQMGIFRLGGAR